jgi:DUF4097 and DUF4098 domain-containing protein YvlB
MKKFLLLSGFLIACWNLEAQTISDNEPYLLKNLSGESIAQMRVETSGGSISAHSSVLAEARLEMYVRRNNGRSLDLSKEEIKKLLEEDYDIQIAVANHQLTAIVEPKNKFMNGKRSLSISFKVFLPEQVSSNLHTSGGSIDLKGFTGTQDISTSGGSLHVENITGKVTGRTSGGSIDISNAKNDMDMQTSGGSINAQDCAGQIELGTSGGSLTLHNLNGTVHASTSGGSVNGTGITGELSTHTSGGSITLRDLSCSLKTSTSGGNIDVSMKQLGKYIEISNSGGSVSLQIPKGQGLDLNLRGDRIRVNELVNFSGSQKEHELTGTMNGGGIPVTVHNSSGRINLDLN